MQKSNNNDPGLEKTFKQIFEMLKELRDEQRKIRDDQSIIIGNQSVIHEDLQTLKCQIRPNEISNNDQIISNPSSETKEIPDLTDETVQEPSDESAQEFDNQSPIQERHEEATSRSSNSTI